MLAEAAPRIARAPRVMLYAHLHRLFPIAAAADATLAEAILRRLYAPDFPVPASPVDTFGTGPLDAFCAQAGLGDLTQGRPSPPPLEGKPFDERLRAFEALVRERLTSDAYGHLPPPTRHWRKLAGTDLWRVILNR